MKNVLILNLIIILITLIITIGLLLNPIIPPVFSPQVESISIAPGAADPNNDQRFVPPHISIPVESTISWTNADSIQHTVTSDEEGLFDAGPISPGDTFENVFDSAGEYGYHCAIHPFMTGVVIVG
jgi:plastocyanin